MNFWHKTKNCILLNKSEYLPFINLTSPGVHCSIARQLKCISIVWHSKLIILVNIKSKSKERERAPIYFVTNSCSFKHFLRAWLSSFSLFNSAPTNFCQNYFIICVLLQKLSWGEILLCLYCMWYIAWIFASVVFIRFM